MRKTYFQPAVAITRIGLDSLILAGSQEAPSLVTFSPGDGDGGGKPGEAL
jgi:hypothetical protein